MALLQIVLVKIMTFVRSRHLENLADYRGSRFDLIKLILPDHLANKTVTITQHVVGDNCRSEPLSSPTSVIPEYHASLYQLYGALRAVTIVGCP